MGLLFIDGFTHYSDNDILTKWTSYSAVGDVYIKSTPTRRAGAKSLEIGNSSGESITKALSTECSTILVGLAHKTLDLGDYGTDGGFCFLYGTTYLVSITIHVTGEIQARSGTYSDILLGSSSTGVIKSNTWQYIEMRITFNGSTGSYEIRVDGQVVLTGSGKDTGSEGLCNVFKIRGVTTEWKYIQDLYIRDDDTFLGDCRIDTIYPSGVGSNSAWSKYPDTGSNYEKVDDAGEIDNDSTYVYTAGTNNKDSYAFEDLPSPAGVNIYGVALNIVAKKDSGTVTVKPLHKEPPGDGGDETVGDDIYLASDYGVHQHIWETNPADAAAWEDADINGSEFGVQLTS